ERLLRLPGHAGGDGPWRCLLEPRCVDEPDVMATQRCRPFAAIAREAGHLGDERRTPAGEPVEQRRLSDVGTTDNDDCRDRRHWAPQAVAPAGTRRSRRQLNATRRASSVSTYMRPLATTGAI